MADGFYTTYILASTRGVIYVGMTNDLRRRVAEHQQEIDKKSFTSQHQCKKLVYFERFHDPYEAIQREKQLKNWGRKKKEYLINIKNRGWRDLSKEWILPEVFTYEE